MDGLRAGALQHAVCFSVWDDQEKNLKDLVQLPDGTVRIHWNSAWQVTSSSCTGLRKVLWSRTQQSLVLNQVGTVSDDRTIWIDTKLTPQLEIAGLTVAWKMNFCLGAPGACLTQVGNKLGERLAAGWSEVFGCLKLYKWNNLDVRYKVTTNYSLDQNIVTSNYGGGQLSWYVHVSPLQNETLGLKISKVILIRINITLWNVLLDAAQ